MFLKWFIFFETKINDFSTTKKAKKSQNHVFEILICMTQTIFRVASVPQNSKSPWMTPLCGWSPIHNEKINKTLQKPHFRVNFWYQKCHPKKLGHVFSKIAILRMESDFLPSLELFAISINSLNYYNTPSWQILTKIRGMGRIPAKFRNLVG